MAELLVVSNPKKRRRLTAKQIAAGFGGKRHRKARRGRKAHHRARRRRSRPSGARPMTGYVVGKKRIRRWKLNPHHRRRRRHYFNTHHRRRRHRNPGMGRPFSQFMPTLRAGAWGATGALMLDGLWGFVAGSTLGQQYLSNPYVGYAAKIGGALLVGRFGGMVLRGRSQQLAVGAATVVTHDFLKSLLVTMMPTVFGPGGNVPLGSYVSGFGSYVSGLGGAAPIVGTATVPQAYLPFSGPSGSFDAAGSGMYVDDVTGMDAWQGDNASGRVGY